MQVKWLVAALNNLSVEADYIAADNPAAAVEKVFTAVYRLALYPALGRPGRVLGTRELIISDTPYIVPYRVRGQSLEILRVFHCARKWPSTF